MTETDAAAAFNAAHPVGTPVRYWPGLRKGFDGADGFTRSPAWMMGGHTAVVSVTDYSGGIALTHVEVTE